MDWLKERLYYCVEELKMQNPNWHENQYLEVILALICTFQLDEAIELAIDKNMHMLAQFIFNYKKQTKLNPSELNIDAEILQNPTLLSIYELLSGQIPHSIWSNLTLLHKFAIYIWYHSYFIIQIINYLKIGLYVAMAQKTVYIMQ